MHGIEVYRNSSEYISLSIYSGDTAVDADALPTITLYDMHDNSVIVTDSVARTDVGKYRWLIPINLTTSDRHLRAVWSFSVNGTAATKTDIIDIVTPYIGLDEVRSRYPQLSTKTFDELKSMERYVRLIINSYTSQDFGSHFEHRHMYGTPGDTLLLGGRMWRLDSLSVDGVDIPDLHQRFRLNESGTAIIPIVGSRPHNDIKKDMVFGVYNSVWGSFGYHTEYHVAGMWGWEFVPARVSAAAMLLIGDYYCSDNTWRQRGITSVRAADWRFEFGDHTFKGTGNVDADMLLSPYVESNMVVI